MNKRANSTAPMFTPPPLMDGCFPVFLECGRDPTEPPGLEAAMGSMCRFGSDYFEKTGPDTTDWTSYPPPTGLDYPRAMRPGDAGAAFVTNVTRMQFAGHTNIAPGDQGSGIGIAGASYSFSATDRYFAVPEYFPRAGAIRRLAFFAAKASFIGGSRFQQHVYSSGVCATSPFEGYPYPDQLLLSGAIFDPFVSGINMPAWGFAIFEDLVNLSVEAGSFLWFVTRHNTNSMSAASKCGIAEGSMPPWMGFRMGASDPNATCGCGWTHAHTFNSGAAQTFPQSAPVVIPSGASVSGPNIPAIGFGFQQDM